MNFLQWILPLFDALSMPRAAVALLCRWLRFVPGDIKAAHELMSRAAALGDRLATRVACETLLTVDPEHPEALQKLADIYLMDGDTKAAVDLYVRIDLHRGGSSLRTRLYRSAYMDPARVASEDPYVHSLRDVILETDQCAIFDGEKVYIRETGGMNFSNHPYVNGRATPDLSFYVVSCPTPTAVIEEPCILIGTDGGTNYSHWVSRNVLKFALLEMGDIPVSLPLLINADPRSYQLEYIDLLGIPRSRLLPVRRGGLIQCREIVVPTLLRNHSKMRIGIEWLRTRLAQFIEPAQNACDLLFISRKDSRRRMLLNEEEIEAALAQLGFTTVVLSEMSVTEQIRSFSRARVIVGAHGAGLTNLMFAPPQAAVVEITNARIHHMNDVRFISAQMGQRYTEVVSGWFPDTQPAGEHQVLRYNYYVETRDVIEALREVAHEVFPSSRR